jgi:FkbM family methyltransferase
MNHFFDVGANIGQTFDKYLLKTNEYDGHKIWCFEPSPRNMGALVENAKKVTGWPHGEIHNFEVVVCPYGLWDKAGSFFFYEKKDALDPQGRENGEGDSFIESFLTNNSAGYRINAVTVSASAFILANTLPEDSITIKLDCEGGEFGILEDLLKSPEALKRVKKFIVEWHTTNEFYKKEALVSEYLKLGYTLEDWPF